jgi:hypothetical protein
MASDFSEGKPHWGAAGAIAVAVVHRWENDRVVSHGGEAVVIALVDRRAVCLR